MLDLDNSLNNDDTNSRTSSFSSISCSTTTSTNNSIARSKRSVFTLLALSFVVVTFVMDTFHTKLRLAMPTVATNTDMMKLESMDEQQELDLMLKEIELEKLKKEFKELEEETKSIQNKRETNSRFLENFHKNVNQTKLLLQKREERLMEREKELAARLFTSAPTPTPTTMARTNNNNSNNNNDKLGSRGSNCPPPISASSDASSSQPDDYTWVGNRWIPPKGIPYYTPVDMRNIFRKEKTLWIGDSLARQDFGTASSMILHPNLTTDIPLDVLSSDIAWDSNSGRKNTCQHPRGKVFYPMMHRCYQINDDNDDDDDGWFDLLWQIKSIRYLSMIQEFLTGPMGSQIAKHNYTTIVFEVGTWDITQGNCDRNATLVQNTLVQVLEFLGEYATAHTTTVLWKTQVASNAFTPQQHACSEQLLNTTRNWFLKRQQQQERQRQLGYGSADDSDNNLNNNHDNFVLVDFAHQIRNRALGSQRIEGDHVHHFGVEGRTLGVQMITQEVHKLRCGTTSPTPQATRSLTPLPTTSPTNQPTPTPAPAPTTMATITTTNNNNHKFSSTAWAASDIGTNSRCGPGIPKLIHFVYLSPHLPTEQPPIPDRVMEVVEQWQKMNPEWKVRLWNNAMVREHYPDLAHLMSNVTQMDWVADMARYNILQQFGGVCLDTGFIPFRPLDSLCQQSGLKNFVVCRGNGPSGSIENSPDYGHIMLKKWKCNVANNAVMGFEPNHPAVTKALNITTRFRLKYAGPKAWTAATKDDPTVTVLHPYTFVRCSYTNKKDCIESKYRNDHRVFAMHSWDMSLETSSMTTTTTTTNNINNHDQLSRMARTVSDDGTNTTPEETSMSNMEKLKDSLLGAHIDGTRNAVRYYVYDDPDMVREDVRKMCREGHRGLWKERWGGRYKEFGYHEVMLLEALERNKFMRTYDASQADFFLVPIPITGLIWMTDQSGSETKKAWNTLFGKELWKKFPEKHVALTEMESIFRKFSLGRGYDIELYSEMKKMTIAKDMDFYSWDRILQVGSLRRSGYNNDYGHHLLGALREYMPRYSFSINYIGSASMPHYAYNPVTFDSFQNKTYNFFYHTRTSESLFNSTQYRHMPVRVKDSLPQPSSVGWDIPPDQWMREFQDSKFCLVIRGDNPSTRALFRAVRAGCLPVIISEFLPYYAPIFRSQIQINDYSIMIKEEQFMRDPVGTLTQAINLTPTQLRERVKSLAIAQQLFMTDRPDSLFAEAFAIEAVAAQKEEYYAFPEDLYQSPMY